MDFYTKDGHYLKTPDGHFAGSRGCCCPTSCGATITCEQASSVRQKCGDRIQKEEILDDGTIVDTFWQNYETGCGSGDVYTTPTEEITVYLTYTVTMEPNEDDGICGTAITWTRTWTPNTTPGATSCTSAIECLGGPLTQCDGGDEATNCALIIAGSSSTLYGCVHISVADEYTTEILVETVLASMPDYSVGECEASFAISEDEFTAAVTKLRYSIVTADPVAWDVRFTPADGGSPTITHHTAIADEVFEIIPDGTVQGTWQILNFHCV